MEPLSFAIFCGEALGFKCFWLLTFSASRFLRFCEKCVLVNFKVKETFIGIQMDGLVSKYSSRRRQHRWLIDCIILDSKHFWCHWLDRPRRCESLEDVLCHRWWHCFLRTPIVVAIRKKWFFVIRRVVVPFFPLSSPQDGWSADAWSEIPGVRCNLWDPEFLYSN